MQRLFEGGSVVTLLGTELLFVSEDVGLLSYCSLLFQYYMAATK